ncbi:effector-associated domain 2-containing protein [Streptomyces longispororuber]|uniref:effector-associated domain 2-containing protein n=1 Tax=Streptomyces longispororuber TaxID=68230 RepID=UPI002109B154|nr:caspase family protein [Streptomyces longispororuber]MCQ4211163.1 caspase family protein [Streptomyces longispororuber]
MTYRSVTDVDPARVTALVVGVEHYAAGDGWRLPGPACDALRFYAWLRERGVPESNILLHLSPAGDRQPGPAHRPADHATLRDALVRELSTRRGDVLWVWWGGHGVLDQDERVRLYCADATADDRRNIDLESARRRLASDALAGFGHQTWVVDACQTFDERHGFPDTLPTEHLPAGGRTDVHAQALLLAATRGQRAANDPERRTGLFSDLVLKTLDQTGIGAAPDPVPLFAGVRALVEREWAAGRTEQLPTLILKRPGHEETLRPAAARAGNRGGLAALNRVVDVLLTYPLTHSLDERQTLVLLLEPRLTAQMRRNPAARPDLVAIVRAHGNRADDLWALYEAVASLDSDPGRAAELRSAIDGLAHD